MPDPPGAPRGRTALPRATSAFVYGRSRTLINLVLYAIAEATNTHFHWLDVRSKEEGTPGFDPAKMGWLDDRRRWAVDRFEGLAPDDVRANAAIFELVRSDEPPMMLARLADFLRLPPTMQRILAEMQPPGGPGLLAVANSDRIARSIPDAILPPILDAFEWAGCSLFVGFADAPPPIRTKFGRVIRVEGESLQDWEAARIILERGTPFGGLRVGERTGVTELPFAERVFRRATGVP